MMNISFSNNLNFKGKSNNQDPTLPLAVIPGLHQFVNGRTKEGLIFSGGDIGLGVAAYLLSKYVIKDAAKGIASIIRNDNSNRTAAINSLNFKKNGYYIIGATAIILEILNFIDAYRHPKKK